MFKKITNICLFLTPALVFAFPGGYWLGVIMFSSLGVVTLVSRRISLREAVFLSSSIPAVWGFLVYVLLHVFSTLYHGYPAKDFGNVVPFVLAPLVFISLAKNELNIKYFWNGCATGSIVSFAIAVFQVYFLQEERAFGFSNPILFGDTSVILGAAAVVGSFFARSESKNPKHWALLLVGGACGLLSSLLSGSKGGWLSVFTIIVLIGHSATRQMHFRLRVLTVLGFALFLGLFLHFTPKLLVIDRVISAIDGTREWMKTGRVTDVSASIRLEAFKAGLLAGAQNPVVGLGWQGELKAFEEAVESGRIRKEFLEANVIDNDLISLFSSKGLVGVFGAVAVHVAVFYTFWLYRKDKSTAIKSLTSLGFLLVLFYFEFGLTVSIFGRSIFRTMYVTWAILLTGLIFSEQYRSRCSGNPPSD